MDLHSDVQQSIQSIHCIKPPREIRGLSLTTHQPPSPQLNPKQAISDTSVTAHKMRHATKTLPQPRSGEKRGFCGNRGGCRVVLGGVRREAYGLRSKCGCSAGWVGIGRRMVGLSRKEMIALNRVQINWKFSARLRPNFYEPSPFYFPIPSAVATVPLNYNH